MTKARSIAAEALGTLLLVATVVGSGLMAERLAGGNGAVALLGNTLATAAMLYVLITALGPVSGAHFNPAVTLVFVLRRDLRWPLALGFVAAQLAGGVLGTLLAHAMFAEPLVQFSTQARSGGGQWLSEIVATFALLFTILMTLRSRPESVPLAVALVIAAGYWFTASTSFANPAVTIARSLTGSFSGIAPGDVPMFIAAQFVGAVFGWLAASWLYAPPTVSSAPR